MGRTKIGLYHDNEIHCDNESGKFYVTGDRSPQKNFEDITLKGLYKKIDQARKVKFTPIPCYATHYSRDVPSKGRITSLYAGNSGKDLEACARFVGDGGQPRLELGSTWDVKTWKDSAYPCNAHNNALVEELAVLEIAMRDLREEQVQLRQKMQTFTQAEKQSAERKEKKAAAASEGK